MNEDDKKRVKIATMAVGTLMFVMAAIVIVTLGSL